MPTVAWSPSSFGEADDAPIRLLQRFGIAIKPNPHGRRLSEEEAISHLEGVDGLIAGLEPLNRRVLSSARSLRAIARVGAGIDNVDVEAVEELGIRLSNTPHPPSQAVAELTLAAALTLQRGLVAANAGMHAGIWKKVLMPGLHGVPLLLVGFGRIGRSAARRFQAFGAPLMVTDPAFTPEPGVDVEPVALHEGLPRASIVSLHAGGREPLLGPREFALMRPGTVLLNSARAELVDQTALLEALDQGRVSAAWFDVFWSEPYAGQLLAYDQVLLTPHLGTYTDGCRREMEMEATLNLLRDLGVRIEESG